MLGAQGKEKTEDLSTGARVEVSRWLIGEDKWGAVDQRPGDGYVLLPTGQARRQRGLAAFQADCGDQLVSPGLAIEVDAVRRCAHRGSARRRGGARAQSPSRR